MSPAGDATIALLKDLVAIDSVNPSLVPGARGEAQIAQRIAAELMSIGLRVDITEVAPGRPNVVGVLEGRAAGRSLMYCGHIDTVGVSGMQKPFEPVEHEGRLYGRGSQDMKGGVAAMIGAARRLAESGGLSSGRLLIAAVIDEEHASLGADALVTKFRADGGVVTEPTDLDIAVAHKGFQWIEIETHGRAAHGSRPLEGRDAILRMGAVLAGLQVLDRQLRAAPGHDRLGTASLHAATIVGGREWSSYPDQCVVQVERRTLPGEPDDVALAEANTILAAVRQKDREFEGTARFIFGRKPYEIDARDPLPARLAEAAAVVGRPTRQVGMTFWTDAAILGAAGIPAVLFGPGGAGLHSTEEYVRLRDVECCRDTLAELARAFTRS
jgi:acetylornithine deacetylase/succinyl-diaminopimelate desuccinylase family protein